jgi:hypothetical protein
VWYYRQRGGVRSDWATTIPAVEHARKRQALTLAPRCSKQPAATPVLALGVLVEHNVHTTTLCNRKHGELVAEVKTDDAHGAMTCVAGGLARLNLKNSIRETSSASAVAASHAAIHEFQ